MSKGFWDSILFALTMTLREIGKNNPEKQKKREECYTKIAGMQEKLINALEETFEKVIAKNNSSVLITGTAQLVPFCYYTVIERYGRISLDQKEIISIYFKNTNLPFSEKSFCNAALSKESLREFEKTMHLSMNSAGIFWKELFRCFIKCNNPKLFQTTIDLIIGIISTFAELGNMEEKAIVSLCNYYEDCINRQFVKARDIADDELDWLGIVPVQKRIEKMRSNYEELIDHCTITEDIPKEDLMIYFEGMFLYGICDMVLDLSVPYNTKIDMLFDIVNFIGIKTDSNIKDMFDDIIRNTENGQFYHSLYSPEPELGAFWNIVTTMSIETQMAEKFFAITSNLPSISIQLENFMGEKYPEVETKDISQNYYTRILGKITA